MDYGIKSTKVKVKSYVPQAFELLKQLLIFAPQLIKNKFIKVKVSKTCT
jgi:hypothetical protein